MCLGQYIRTDICIYSYATLGVHIQTSARVPRSSSFSSFLAQAACRSAVVWRPLGGVYGLNTRIPKVLRPRHSSPAFPPHSFSLRLLLFLILLRLLFLTSSLPLLLLSAQVTFIPCCFSFFVIGSLLLLVPRMFICLFLSLILSLFYGFLFVSRLIVKGERVNGPGNEREEREKMERGERKKIRIILKRSRKRRWRR